MLSNRMSQFAVFAAALAVPAVTWGEAAATSATKTARKPNIIFILSDDVGIGNIGCYGSDNFKTPKIDALAKSGTLFTHCFSTPLCGPSRSQILTGRYPFRTGMVSNGSTAALSPANESMIPTTLKKAGYVTAAVGKWSQLPLKPSDWGFDEYLWFAGSGKYWNTQGKNYIVDGKTVPLGDNEYIPDVLHKYVVDFVTRHKDQPFYIHYAMSSIHGPIMRTPDSTSNSQNLYADNNAYMDKLVGKLVAELERLKLRDNTLLVFVGDNGTARPGDMQATIKGRHLSGEKGTMLEGGSRVPMIVSWPGTTPAGKINNDLVDFSDFFPTFAAVADAKLPEGVTIDGHSFLPQAEGKSGTPREWVYVELGGRWYARSTGWKLTKSGELFDMSEAPFVEKPVPADSQNPEAVAARKKLQAVLDQLNPAAGKQDGLTGKRQRPGKGQRKMGKGANAVPPNAPQGSPDKRQQRRQQRQAERRAVEMDGQLSGKKAGAVPSASVNSTTSSL